MGTMSEIGGNGITSDFRYLKEEIKRQTDRSQVREVTRSDEWLTDYLGRGRRLRLRRVVGVGGETTQSQRRGSRVEGPTERRADGLDKNQ